ncbi:MAG: galactose mutarotase [Clostridiales bacterium]|nr:galactose mutarotase [Clostridiales bacterium]
MVIIKPFGMIEKTEVPLIEITGGGLKAEFIPYGASVRSLFVPNKEGGMTDAALGYDTLEEYVKNDGCMGAIVGPCANRIRGAKFSIDGKKYILEKNEGNNCNHSGSAGLYMRLWDFETGENSVTFKAVSKDGEGGFPGNLKAEVTYTLKDSSLIIEYSAVTDKATPVNFTNHTYFNLSGEGKIFDHIVGVNSDFFTPSDSENIPTGEICTLEGTPFDLRNPVSLGERLKALPKGLDCNYVLKNGGKPAVTAYCPKTGINLTFETNMEGAQLYTSGLLTERKGKNGSSYGNSSGLCIEAQHFPNAVNQPNFPSPVLYPGDKYIQKTVYKFSVK